MPTWASAPMRSSSAMSVAVAMPPAAVTRAPPAPHEIADQLGIRALSQCGVEIHDGHLSSNRELLQSRDGIAAVQREFLAAPQLHRATGHDVDARYDHRRTRIPRTARSALMPSTVSSPS